MNVSNFIDRTIRKYMDKFHIPGVSIALVDNYRLVETLYFGVEPGTRFQAASISKPVAALIALYFVAKGKLDLDKDINSYLKNCMVKSSKPITLRQLLSHSAGLNVTGFDGYDQKDKLPTLLEILNGLSPANSPAILKRFRSGTYRYSGGGYVILQKLLQDISKGPLSVLAKHIIFSKLKMTNSTYSLLYSDKNRNIAIGYDVNGKMIRGKWRLHPESAAAGLWTTPSDLAKFIIEIQRTFRNKSKKVVSKKLIGKMISPQLDTLSRKPFENVGLGLFLYKNHGHTYFGHSGANAGYRSRFIATDNGKAIIIMTNGDLGFKLINNILPILGKELKWPIFPQGKWV